MSNQDIGNVDNVTDTTTENTNQATATKTYTQEEFDQHMARMKASISKKYEKTFAELGDIEELKNLKTEAEKRRQEESVKRGEFEKILQEKAQKWEAEVAKRDSIIREYTVDVPLVTAAANFKAVNAEQVKSLLKPNVRLSQDGEVEIVDKEGKVRYNDAGQPFKVEDLVKEFLDTNPHFKQATPATTNGKSNIGQSREKVDISKLDMKNPEDRKIYKEWRKTSGIAN
jgi:arsenate reductase-like glutaredoxin family protein